MGLSASKRVSHSLNSLPEFNSACDSVYDVSLALSQHAFSGIKPYQLLSATQRLHHSLLANHSITLISKWVPLPPDQGQVDRAFKCILTRRSGQAGPPQEQEGDHDVLLGKEEFKEFSVELFTNAVVFKARSEILKRVPIGAVGITGIGLVMRPRKEVVGAAIGVYAIGVATAVYISLAG